MAHCTQDPAVERTAESHLPKSATDPARIKVMGGVFLSSPNTYVPLLEGEKDSKVGRLGCPCH